MAAETELEDQNALDANRNFIGSPQMTSKSQNPAVITDEELNLIKEKVGLLPEGIQKKISELETAFDDGEVTKKGYNKKLRLLIEPHFHKLQNSSEVEIELYEPNMNTLPKFVLEQLEELEKELKEEEITLKGYKRKRERLLGPFMLREPPLSTLSKATVKELDELSKEYEEGDLTEKGYKKRRTKIMTPYLVKANAWSSMVSVLPNKSNVVTVFVPNQNKQKELLGQASGIQIMNGSEKLFKCQLCNEVFKQAQSFSGHCRLHRSGKAKAYKCTVCKASYTTRSHLKFHMYKHTGNYPYTCEYCGKGFAGRSQYRYHVLRHSGQSPYICKECGGRFWKKRNLEVHCSKHRCDDAPTGLQKCAHCHAMFEELEDLQSHMYAHDTEVGSSEQATMVHKNSTKGERLNSTDDVMDPMGSEDEEEQIDDDDQEEMMADAEEDHDGGAKEVNDSNGVVALLQAAT